MTNEDTTLTDDGAARRTAIKTGAVLAAAGLATSLFGAAASAASKPPAIAAPKGGKPVLVVLRLSAKDGAAFQAHLLKVIPITRLASGCRYSHTYRSADNAAEFTLIQGWDSRPQQEGYIKWREETGDLKQFLEFLAKPPVVEFFDLIDA